MYNVNIFSKKCMIHTSVISPFKKMYLLNHVIVVVIVIVIVIVFVFNCTRVYARSYTLVVIKVVEFFFMFLALFFHFF